MAQYQILLLPLLALTLVIFFPVMESDPSLSGNWRSSRRRRRLFGKISVAVLLVAALITEIRPAENMNSLLQGFLLTVAMLTPVGIALSAYSFRRFLRRKKFAKKQQRKQSPDGATVTLTKKHTVAADTLNSDNSSLSLHDLDKDELKSLVLEQQSSIERERRSHHRCRNLSRDALIVMRAARAAQKNAEKLAQRERLKRKKIEQQFEKHMSIS